MVNIKLKDTSRLQARSRSATTHD